MIFACSLIEPYQLGGWYLNANHGEIGYIYKTNNYSLMQTLNFALQFRQRYGSAYIIVMVQAHLDEFCHPSI